MDTGTRTRYASFSLALMAGDDGSPIIGAMPNPAPPSSPYSHLKDVVWDDVIDGVEGDSVPAVVFISVLHEEWDWWDWKAIMVSYPVDVVMDGAASFTNRDIVRNHESWNADALWGHIIESKGKMIGPEQAGIAQHLHYTDKTARNKLRAGLLRELSIGFRLEEEYDVTVDEDGNATKDNFRVTKITGDHLGTVVQGAVSTGDGAGVGIGADLAEFSAGVPDGLREALEQRIDAAIEAKRAAGEAIGPDQITEIVDDCISRNMDKAKQHGLDDEALATVGKGLVAYRETRVKTHTSGAVKRVVDTNANDGELPLRRKETGTMSDDKDSNPQAGLEQVLAEKRAIEFKLAEVEKEREAALTAATADADAIKARLAEYEQAERVSVLKQLSDRTGKDAAEFEADSTENLKRVLDLMGPKPETKPDVKSFEPARDDASANVETGCELQFGYKGGVFVMDGEQYHQKVEATWGDVFDNRAELPSAKALKRMSDERLFHLDPRFAEPFAKDRAMKAAIERATR